jgi:hypothetical protein
MAEGRAFRFGAGVAGAGSRAEWVAVVRRIEELGYQLFDDMFLYPQHLQLLAVLPPWHVQPIQPR